MTMTTEEMIQNIIVAMSRDPSGWVLTSKLSESLHALVQLTRTEAFKEAAFQQYQDRNEEADSAYAKGFADCREKGVKAFDSELELLQGQFQASRGVAVKRDLDVCLRHQDKIRALKP